ncbi:MFS transporter [Paenibacillus sp. IITD108]|uniref:MFS transporter n=1 Tax=Paenibacillus sp. IITD108 TaxID=3116649 RepID=UPI002F3ECFF5
MFRTTKSQKYIFTLVTLIYWISMYIYVPTFSPYLNSKGFSLQFIGIVISSYGLVQLLVRFPLGIWSDRFGKRKPFIVLGMLCALISCLLFLLSGSWIWPLAGRIVAGVCASTWVAYTVMYAGFFKTEQTGRAMGNISFVTVSGQMIGMLLSGWLADGFHANMPFIIGAAAAVLGLLLALFLQEHAVNDRQGMSLANVKEVVKTKLLWRVSYLSILAHCVLFITMFGFTPLKAEALGAGGLELTIVVFAFMLPHAVASFITATIFVPRFGQYGTIMISFVLSGICTAAIAIVPSLELLYVTQAVNGFAQGLHLPLFLGLAIKEVASWGRATAMGLYQAVYAAGMFSGPFLAGFLNQQWGLGSGFALGSVLALAAAIFTAIWAGQERKRKKKLPAEMPSSLQG